MRLAGILPLELTYKLAMRMFEQKGDAEGLLEAYDELQHNGYAVDQVSRNILLDMHMKRGDLMNADRVFSEMLQTPTGADLYAYNRVLEMYIMVRLNLQPCLPPRFSGALFRYLTSIVANIF